MVTASAAVRRRRRPIARLVVYLRQFGLAATLSRIARALHTPDRMDYRRWVARYDTLTRSDERAIRARVDALPSRPLISVLVPLHDPDPDRLRRAIESVRGQFYPDWELCLIDDASTDLGIAPLLAEFAALSPRIKFLRRVGQGGISAAGNDALGLASGAFCAVLDPADELRPHALYMTAAEIAAQPDAVLIYSDQDRIDAAGRRHEPYFKPDWNPALLHGQNYIDRLAVYRTERVRALGGFRSDYDGGQDYDLTLRVSRAAKAGQIRHIPHILYHRGDGDGAAPAAIEASRRALADHFRTTGEAVEIGPAPIPAFRRVRRRLPAILPKVTLIVPTRDRVELLRNCLTGLLEQTDYPALEVVVVDNDSAEPATLTYLAAIERDPRVRVLRVPGPFDFSRLNNLAVAATEGALLGFINNDIAVIAPGWLKEMVAEIERPEVAAVGAMLYYGNDTIQHAGVVLGIGGVGGHWEKHTPRGAPGYFGRLLLAHNVGCVTAACMLMRRAVFNAVGGFTEQTLAIAFNDVDLCLKARQAGYEIIWTPHAELYHLESASRGDDVSRARVRRFRTEVAYMRKHWAEWLDHDPYHSPNLTLDSEIFGFAFPPRAGKPWR